MEFAAFESPLPFRTDLALDAWHRQLAALPSKNPSIREASATARDARRVWDLQLACPPITVRSLRHNAATIAKSLVLLAEIDDIHVGFSVSLPGPKGSDPLFVQVVAVVPEAQRRGIGLALLAAATEREPHRDIALATRDDNVAAHAMNQRFASSIGATLRRVRLGTYPDRSLGIRRGQGYRTWIVQRPTGAALMS